MSIKPITQKTEPLFKEPVPAAPILPLIKPVNIDPMNRGTNAITVESRQYTVQPASLIKYVLRDIIQSKTPVITVNKPIFDNYFEEHDASYLGKHCRGL